MAFRSVTASARFGQNMLRNYMRPGVCSSIFKAHHVRNLTNSPGPGNNNNNSKKIDTHSRLDIPPVVEGYQGGEHEFTHNQSLEVLSASVEYHYSDRTKSETVEPVEKTVGPNHSPEEDSPQEYDNSGHVSLSSCMQTTVPEPFHASGRSPVHLNMPRQGRNMSEQKYVANKLENIHPSRQFSTSSVQYSVTKSIPESLTGDYDAVPCPQGVQGDDCAQFQLWLDSCRRYGLSNCEDQLQGIQSGRKTIGQVLAEQEILIREIAEAYRSSVAQSTTPAAFGEIDIDSPCPQGVQGEDCEQFKLWLKNCQQFGFGNCMEQLQGVQGGRRTLAQIFKEQDDMIRNITKRFHSTSSSSQWKVGKGSESRTLSTDSSPPPSPAATQKLSQKDRLKRAVKDYGATVVVFHVGISLISLGGFYLVVSSGIDVVGMLSKLGVGESFLKSQVLTGASTFVIAYAVHKVFAPVRIAITLTSTPFIVRHLRKIGFLKPPKVVSK